MAECSYARCLQERRHIKRELMKWSKDMLYIFGLERVAEELMGHRKWKQYQEAITRTQFSADITNLDQVDILNNKVEQISENIKKNSHRQPFENYAPNIKAFEVNDKSLISSLTKLEKVKSTLVVAKGCLEFNNSTIASHSISCKNSKENTDGGETNPPTSPKEPPLEAVDWNPHEKCNFCDAGKLLTVNEKGELVAESSPALSEADHAIRLPGGTESDSSDSAVPDPKVDVKKVLASHLRDSVTPNMTSLESMAAQWPGLQSGLGQLYPCILYNLTQHVNSATPTTSETSAAAISPSLKDSPSPSDLTGEQPLDLSSKPSPNSSTGGDARHVHRAKSRMAPISGRRTYTEEELNNALQDIISGKLGTRRAAVQYNIPRSTLRNKVYKISSGAKREVPTPLQYMTTSLEDLADIEYDKHDLSADEEDSNGDKVQNSSLIHTSDDLASRIADASVQKSNVEQQKCHTPEHPQCQPHDIDAQTKATTSQESQPKHKASSSPQLPPQSQSSPIGQNAWQNVLLHSLLLSGGLPMQQNLEEALQIFNAFLLKQDLGLLNPQLLMQLQQSQQSAQQQPHQITQEQQNLQSKSAAAVLAQATSFQNRLPKSETPETESSVDLNEALGDDPSVILKIPSYKPVAVSFTSTSSATAASALCNNKNIENLPPSSPKILTPSTLVGPNTSAQQLHHNHHRHPHHHSLASSTNNIPVTSPPLKCHASGESRSPPTLSLRDVIANSISRTFNQQAKIEASSSSPAHSTSSAMDYSDQYKRPSISVIKNIGGTDTSRFATAPNLLGSHLNSNHHHHQHHSQNLANNNLAGGKGTRPKRGKYRNYDRDSLVEAVKAVQRGEMSVHRAGSYYGVPHSTLEYKVKERHLMRPRKREPKTQPPLDDRTGENNSSGNISGSTLNTLKTSNIQGLSAVNNLDSYSKSGSNPSTSINQTQSVTGKSNPPYPKTSSNGMKIPPALFEQSLAAQLQYPPHLFWHGGFGPLQMDFSARSQAAAAATVAAATMAGSASGSFASNSELLKSQMLQRFHEEHGGGGPSNAMGSPPLQPVLSNSSSSTNSKSVRDIAETLYEPGGDANGSFLDGIIRKTLDRKSSESKQGGSGALIDQLGKNKNTSPSRIILNNERMTSDFQNMKRTGSSIQQYHHSKEIKRERASPTSDFSNSDSEKNNRRYSESEQQQPPTHSIPDLHHVAGLDHNLISDNSDLNDNQHAISFMSSSHNMSSAKNVSATSKSMLNISSSNQQQHSKLENIKSETEDSL